MFLICYLFLLPILTCNLTNNYKQKIKRAFVNKPFKMQSNNEAQSKDSLRKNILNGDKLFSTKYNDKQSQSNNKKGYTQQDLAEVNRILSKKEDDYYGILDIDKHATWNKIINAYKKLMLRVHPDKFNTPGATKAAQRLNNARVELEKKYGNRNQARNQQTAQTLTTQSSTLIRDKNQNVSDINHKSNSVSTPSPTSLEKKKEVSKTSSIHMNFYYFLYALCGLILGFIIFIIIWAIRKRQTYLSTHGNISKKSKIPLIYDSPTADDNEITTINNGSEASIIIDEE